MSGCLPTACVPLAMKVDGWDWEGVQALAAQRLPSVHPATSVALARGFSWSPGLYWEASAWSPSRDAHELWRNAQGQTQVLRGFSGLSENESEPHLSDTTDGLGAYRD